MQGAVRLWEHWPRVSCGWVQNTAVSSCDEYITDTSLFHGPGTLYVTVCFPLHSVFLSVCGDLSHNLIQDAFIVVMKISVNNVVGLLCQGSMTPEDVALTYMLHVTFIFLLQSEPLS